MEDGDKILNMESHMKSSIHTEAAGILSFFFIYLFLISMSVFIKNKTFFL